MAGELTTLPGDEIPHFMTLDEAAAQGVELWSPRDDFQEEMTAHIYTLHELDEKDWLGRNKFTFVREAHTTKMRYPTVAYVDRVNAELATKGSAPLFIKWSEVGTSPRVQEPSRLGSFFVRLVGRLAPKS